MTLVHYSTTFTIQPSWQKKSLGRILGHGVTVQITPIRYDWTFGDGETRTTRHWTTVRHGYERAGEMRASVSTTYEARYRVDGGGSRRIPGTVTVQGPEKAVQVRSAHAQLIAGSG